MKKLWNYVSFLAVVNMLALIMFVGWLWQSGRLDEGRARQLRELFATTIAEAEEEAADRAAALAAEQAEAADRAQRANPPLPSSATVALTALVDTQTEQAVRRLKDQTDQHLAELAFREQQLGLREQELRAQRDAWQRSIEAEANRRRDEQFAKTVRLYESLAGKQAKRMLLELVAQGEVDQAVAYLDAMSTRAATKTLRELKTDEENKLATELLEQLRVLGIDATDPETTRDDPASESVSRPAGPVRARAA